MFKPIKVLSPPHQPTKQSPTKSLHSNSRGTQTKVHEHTLLNAATEQVQVWDVHMPNRQGSKEAKKQANKQAS
jgi:hypothetical protein